MPSLKTIDLGEEVFLAADSVQPQLGYFPYKFNMSLTMRSTSLLFGLFLDLSSLEELEMKDNCLYFVSHIELKSRIGVDES